MYVSVQINGYKYNVQAAVKAWGAESRADYIPPAECEMVQVARALKLIVCYDLATKTQFMHF